MVVVSGAPVAREIDGAAVCRAISDTLDAVEWTLEANREGVSVFSGRDPAWRCIGYRTVTEHRVSVEELADFLGPGLLDAFQTLNHRYVEGTEFQSAEEGGRVVRTSFRMPPGLADREFVHWLGVEPLDADTTVVAYHAVGDSWLPPVQKGYVRCPILPSGQRIRRTNRGTATVEHLMVYELAGRIAPWMQNWVFHRGHVGAYVDEWSKLVSHFGGST